MKGVTDERKLLASETAGKVSVSALSRPPCCSERRRRHRCLLTGGSDVIQRPVVTSSLETRSLSVTSQSAMCTVTRTLSIEHDSSSFSISSPGHAADRCILLRSVTKQNARSRIKPGTLALRTSSIDTISRRRSSWTSLTRPRVLFSSRMERSCTLSSEYLHPVGIFNA